MEKEKLFLDENLNLNSFSIKMDADPNMVSFILNKHLGKNFYEFVNFYRTEEVKARLLDERYKNMTILGIAFDCGFNSKTAFNRVFKQMTGLTPSRFQKLGAIPHSGTPPGN